MAGERVSLSAVPQALHGRWRVVSYRDPDGTEGPTQDTWEIFPDRVETPEYRFQVAAVTGNIEPDQDLHLVSFSNNGLQFAFLRSQNQPGRLLVVWYLSGREARRFLLEGPAEPGAAADRAGMG